jgi:subtilisin family serine protease
MLKVRHLLFLACVVPAISLCHADSASAAWFGRGAGLGRGAGFGRGAAPPRPFMGRPALSGPRIGALPTTFSQLRNHGFNRPPTPGQQLPHGFDRGPLSPRDGRAVPHGLEQGPPGSRQGRVLPHGLEHGPAGLTRQGRAAPRSFEHGPAGPGRALPRNPSPPGPPGINAIARNGLPHRPFPGEPGFTGVPPRGETRFISNEMIVHVGAEVSPQALDAAARRLGLTQIGSQNLALSGGRLVHFRIPNGQVADAVRMLEAEKIGIAQPNYIFQLQQDARVTALLPKGDPAQYVIDKLHLHDAHRIASGANVTVAVIDSLIDVAHPDLAGSIAGQFDAVTAVDKPDEHGTGMTGAIAAHRRLLGVAPGARILAIHAFSPDAQHPQQATTQNIIAGIDWAIAKGARVINMSFAGPYDPLLQLALKKARDKGVVLIAAAGNMGPQSPPLYPAADENVIAVTAVDENDKLMPQANQGPHVALAAPGVNVLEAAPRATYNFTTGTSVAAAHVSGVAALILERNPSIGPASLEDILSSTARDLGAPGRDPQFGYGLVDPYRALQALEAKAVAGRGLPETTASANPSAKIAPKPPPGAAALISGAPAGPIGPATPPLPKTGAVSPTGKLTVTGMAPSAQVAIEGDESPATVEKKRQACSNDAAAKGVQASELPDYIAVCVGEARLACLKQAVAQKVRGPGRREFMNRCLAGS